MGAVRLHGVGGFGAAYASYRHGQQFALRFGADESTAAIWPLIVDGLLTIATVELWKPGCGWQSSGRWIAWLAFLFGIALSLCANVAAAPELSVFAVAVAARPPLAMLLAVELLNRALKHHRWAGETPHESGETVTSVDDSSPVTNLADVPQCAERQTAEQPMWTYFIAERSQGRSPTGAELDRVVGTHNYGRRIIHNWRQLGKLEAL